MSKNNLVDYILSEDMDILTFGSKNILKNFGKKNMFIINLQEILDEGNISMHQFIEICILLGCDYLDTIPSIGEKKSWNLIKKYNSICNIIDELKIQLPILKKKK